MKTGFGFLGLKVFCVGAVLAVAVGLCFFVVQPGFAEEDYDDEEDMIAEGSAREELSEDGRDEEEKLLRIQRQKMKQWLKRLESLKRSKSEATLLQVVSQILNQDPNNIQALNTLGVFYLQRGKTSLAKIIFTRALKKHPKNSSLHGNLAMIALKEGKKEEAIKAFRKSLSYRYSNYASAANLGTLYMQAYEYDSALEYLDLAYNRAKRYLSLANFDVVKTGNNYAVALSWSGNFGKSEDIFQELIGNNPESVELLLNYAILLGKNMGRKEKSYRFLQKADLMDKKGRYARKIKALRAYLKKGKAGKKRAGGAILPGEQVWGKKAVNQGEDRFILYSFMSQEV